MFNDQNPISLEGFDNVAYSMGNRITGMIVVQPFHHPLPLRFPETAMPQTSCLKEGSSCHQT